MMETKYLIIGNSAGGIGAAETIRQVDKSGTITLISDEPYPAYSRPLISDYLAEGRPLAKMLFRPADFYEKNNIHACLGRKVERLYPDERMIQLKDGSRIAWGKMLLATGGMPIIPPIEGIKKPGVFTFTTLDDAKAIDQSLRRATRALVIGGGLIGVSVTEALVKRGIEVTIIEMKTWILNTILDEAAAALEEEILRQSEVRIITGHTMAKIEATGEVVSSVTLDDGREIPGDLVIVAIGVQPRLELVSGTGIEIKRGIVVDRYMATSCPDVYACGDVAEAYDFIYGENRLTPIWPNAYLGGRVAGFNMAGVPTKYEGGTALNSLKYFGLDIVSAGVVNPDDSCEVLCRRYDHAYRKVVLKEGVVVGMVFAGKIERAGIVFNLMKEKVKADSFKEALVMEDFGLVSLPEAIWRPRLEAPAQQELQATPEPSEEAVIGE